MATAPPKSHAEIAQEASAAGVKNLTAWRLNKSEEQDLAARVTALKAAAEKAGHDFDEADQTMLCKKEVQLRKALAAAEKKRVAQQAGSVAAVAVQQQSLTANRGKSKGATAASTANQTAADASATNQDRFQSRVDFPLWFCLRFGTPQVYNTLFFAWTFQPFKIMCVNHGRIITRSCKKTSKSLSPRWDRISWQPCQCPLRRMVVASKRATIRQMHKLPWHPEGATLLQLAYGGWIFSSQQLLLVFVWADSGWKILLCTTTRQNTRRSSWLADRSKLPSMTWKTSRRSLERCWCYLLRNWHTQWLLAAQIPSGQCNFAQNVCSRFEPNPK